ncbi:MAG TPA: glycine-rich protein [Saprospiraceae bacterium]|nr:glycine-rich protein [Saprospiraceae bacterium]HNT20426.1 glycine-rich protein [Saprospiraceae bacterium]
MQRIRIETWGAQGGGSMKWISERCPDEGPIIQNDGGLGGYAVGELDVVPGQLLYIYVGGQGRVGTNEENDGGYNGGGDGGRYGGGGGGATDVRTNPFDLDSRVIVAGGGGGGNTGCPDGGIGGPGGGTMIGESDGTSLYVWDPPGGGGTLIAGGAAGSYGEAGSWGFGGGTVADSQFHASGGGGGWYGGGSAYGTGGGGGSSMAGMMGYSSLQNGSTILGVREGHGLVVISLLEDNVCSFCELSCNSKVNISMPASECYRIMRPEELLSNVTNNCTTFGYGLTISYPFGTSRLHGNDVDRSHLGLGLIFKIETPDASNSCWGYLYMEDKAPPVAGCMGTREVSCYQLNKLLDLSTQVVDNCSSRNEAVLVRLLFADKGCQNDSVIGVLSRTIRATDSWKNTSICSDTLIITRDSIEETQGPDLVPLACKITCKTDPATQGPAQSDYEDIYFSRDSSHPYYPDPEFLLHLQQRDSFLTENHCIPQELKIVPYLYDSVLIWESGQYIKTWQPVDQYPNRSTFCKIQVSYHDQVLPSCGASAFKIRRQWRLTDWCTGEEKSFIQYIEVADRNPPVLFMENGGLEALDNRLNYNVNTGPHSCLGEVNLKELVAVDCNAAIRQTYRVSFTDNSHPPKITVLEGNLPGKINLPANGAVYGVKCHDIEVTLRDECSNRFDTLIRACIVDETPPEILVKGALTSTMDPATCWSRIYAKDLDNGSRDHCCDVLHFAIATQDSINAARKYVYDAIIEQCGFADYDSSREYYDFYIEDYISSYIFKDYLDLTACEEYQIVVRVWEACGIPRYDPHIWPCSEHQWFLYNAGYPRSHFRADHNLNFGFSQNANYSKFKAPKDCNWRYPLIFCDPLLAEWFALAGLDDFNPYYEGAGAAELCNFDFYWPRLGLRSAGNTSNTSGNPPGNTCSRMLWKDGMVRVNVVDKTPPLAEKPDDLVWYCDGLLASGHNPYEFARCDDDSYGENNAKDHSCVDANGKPYNEIECIRENDSDSGDGVDGTGKPFGWYGCNSYGPSHPGEHGKPVPCASGAGTWAPLYCHSWLCLDASDRLEKTDPSLNFWKPRFHSGPLDSLDAGDGYFWIWDNCKIDSTGLVVKDSSFADACGNGWLQRTWFSKDECGNEVTTSQKIITKHRSDFEVLFPPDVITACTDPAALSQDVLGRPMVMDDECEVVGMVYTDELFNDLPDACYKIVRTWRVINWCKFEPNQAVGSGDILVDDRLIADPVYRPCVYRHLKDNGDGLITYTQIIKVRDSFPPVLACRDTTLCILDQECEQPEINIPFQATDNCTEESQIQYRWELDENPSAGDLAAKNYNKNSIEKISLGNTNRLVLDQAAPVSLVHVFAKDHCGNEDTCTYVLRIEDCKKPTPYCYSGLATVVMPTSGRVTVWARDLDAGSYDNCTAKSALTFSFSEDRNEVKKDFSCVDLPDGKSARIPVRIFVWDETGLFDYCNTHLLIQDGIGNSCPDTLSIIKNRKPVGFLVSTGFSPAIPGARIQGSSSPDKESLLQNLPNPFHSSTRIRFVLIRNENYRLRIVDLTGKTIWTREGWAEAGIHEVMIKESDLKGPGLYYYTLETQGSLITKKMLHTQ